MTAPVINDEASAQVVARIHARIDDGIGAARYDGDGGSSGGPTSSHPERQAIKADELAHKRERDMREQDRVSITATHDLARYQAAVATVREVSAAYPSITAGQFSIPGITPCPPGRCADHWAAGLSVGSSQKPRLERCARCHRFKKDHGEPTPPLVLRAVADLGGPKGPLGQAVYDHALVLRAWDTSGWMTSPVIAKRTA